MILNLFYFLEAGTAADDSERMKKVLENRSIGNKRQMPLREATEKKKKKTIIHYVKKFKLD